MFWDKVAWAYDIFADGLNKKTNRALCAEAAQLIRPEDTVLEDQLPDDLDADDSSLRISQKKCCAAPSENAKASRMRNFCRRISFACPLRQVHLMRLSPPM